MRDFKIGDYVQAPICHVNDAEGYAKMGAIVPMTNPVELYEGY